jgi:hypothetical protein
MKKQSVFLLLLLSFPLLFFAKNVSAQDMTPSISPSLTPVQPGSTPIQSGSTGVDYTLPYPGLLPNHPLYFLKAARDKIQGFFISNPIKKAEFELLQSDKRVEASDLLLADKKNVDLAESTFSKAQNYYEDALARVAQAKKQGMETHDIVQKMTIANHKYLEVVVAIQKKVSAKDKEKFVKDKQRVEELAKKVKSL